MSKRSSPRKEEKKNIINESVEEASASGASGGITGTKLKLRLKVNEATGNDKTNTTAGVTSTSTTSVSSPQFPKIKLNFSRSSESVETATAVVPSSSSTSTPKGKRGRPKKDKSAVKAAALAASQPNEAENEERRGRRRAAEEKIKRSNEPITIVNNNQESENETRKRRNRGDPDEKRKRRHGNSHSHVSNASSSSGESIGKKNSKEFVDITEGPPQASNPVLSNSFNPYENEFIHRSKTSLNIALQHDTFMYAAALTNPDEVEKFKSIEDAVEKLSAFHVGIGAGQFKTDELSGHFIIPDNLIAHEDTFMMLQDRYRSILHSHSTKKVPTELLLLEQRLCLEEEKFLLVKLKNEYASRFLRGSSSGMSSMSSSMSSLSSRPSTPGSINQ